MKQSAILTALYATFLTFSLLALFFGETGVVALKKLEDRNGHLEVNMADLERHGMELSARLGALRSDPEAIIVEARSLGLYREDDAVVMFRNLETQRKLPQAGRVLRMVPAPVGGEGILRILAASVGLVALFVTLILGRMEHAAAPGKR